MDADWEPREYNVPVAAATKLSSFAEREIETEFLGNKSDLIRLPVPALDAQNFLQSNNIRVDVGQNLGDPPGPDAAI